ncbi:MAG: aconitate hydratase AcnA [Desulfobacterota bacterium]|nr:aconitate hydratase AcnA [Thermodesulfobacteriota bacterium]
MCPSCNSFHSRDYLRTESGASVYYRLDVLARTGIADIARLPFSIKVLLESLLRHEDGIGVTRDDIIRLARYNPSKPQPFEVPFKPGRVLLQDFTGVPCMVDLAAMRDAMAALGGNPQRINPRIPVDVVIDHSLQVDVSGTPDAAACNMRLEFDRNRERYILFKWAQQAFSHVRVMPPGIGICHQVNLEYLATVVACRQQRGETVVFPDTVVGTDSHTTMINGLGVVGWGIGGIEAEAVMLGEPLVLTAPPVIGFRLLGRLSENVTATDLVLTITSMLRQRGVVGKIVEFYGSGLASISVPDRATIANMAPEYGATMGFFPVDSLTLEYLRSTGRSAAQIALVETYCKAQGLFRTDDMPDPEFQETLELDLSQVQPCVAGPSRPQDRIELTELKTAWRNTMMRPISNRGFQLPEAALRHSVRIHLGNGNEYDLRHGSVVIASITSCTNTSNPSVMLAAGLLARKAIEAGLSIKPWVKTSLAPGSRVVSAYLEKTGLLPYLEKLGFHIVGYGCATCIGNSGPLPSVIEAAIEEHRLIVTAVVSGNRNFEGRISPLVRANFLASPPLVLAFALAGTVDIDFTADPLGYTPDGRPVLLRDIWPTRHEIDALLTQALDPKLFHAVYDNGDHAFPEWKDLPGGSGDRFMWDETSLYIRKPPYFDALDREPGRITPITGARVLVLLGDSVTTDHISPAGAIRKESPAGKYLMERGVNLHEFNSYGSRRGNHEVMVRGTFASVRLRNQLAPNTEGGYTVLFPDGEVMSIYDAAARYHQRGIPTIVLAGRDYGMGSSRDWAAKGTHLLGVRAVIAESFERIHRSNLAGMGVLPLQFKTGDSVRGLGLTGKEVYSIDIDDSLKPGQEVTVAALDENGARKSFTVVCRLDTVSEVDYYRHGGILPKVLRSFLGDRPE